MAKMTKADVQTLVDVAMGERNEVLAKAFATGQALAASAVAIMEAGQKIASIEVNTKPAAEALTQAVSISTELLSTTANLITAAASVEMALGALADPATVQSITQAAELAELMEQQQSKEQVSA